MPAVKSGAEMAGLHNGPIPASPPETSDIQAAMTPS